jgi:hypothetical protein
MCLFRLGYTSVLCWLYRRELRSTLITSQNAIMALECSVRVHCDLGAVSHLPALAAAAAQVLAEHEASGGVKEARLMVTQRQEYCCVDQYSIEDAVLESFKLKPYCNTYPPQHSPVGPISKAHQFSKFRLPVLGSRFPITCTLNTAAAAAA